MRPKPNYDTYIKAVTHAMEHLPLSTEAMQRGAEILLAGKPVVLDSYADSFFYYESQRLWEAGIPPNLAMKAAHLFCVSPINLKKILLDYPQSYLDLVASL